MSTWVRMKDKTYFTLGALLLVGGIVMVLTAIVLTMSPPRGTPAFEAGQSLIVGAFCTGVAIVPGALLIWRGFKARAFAKELEEFSGWVRAYRRIGLADLARKLGKSEMETEKLLVTVVDRGLVRGFIDRAANEFVVPEAIGQSMFVGACPRCGANVQRQFLVGETPVCPYCSSVIAASVPPPPPPPPPAYVRR